MDSFLAFLYTASGSFVLSVPFLLVDRWLGFAVFATIAGGVFALRKKSGASARNRSAELGLVAAFTLLIPAAFFAQIFESGLDDGPFRGRSFSGDVEQLMPSDSASFRSGKLVIYNRAESEAPVLAYRIGRRTRWAREMYVSTMSRSDEPELREMTKPSVQRGVLRDRLPRMAKTVVD